MLFATNSTTNKIELFEDMETIEFERFARQAVFDYCIDCFEGTAIKTGVNNVVVEINENSSELDFGSFVQYYIASVKQVEIGKEF